MLNGEDGTVCSVNTTDETVQDTDINDLILLQPAPDAIIVHCIPFSIIKIYRKRSNHSTLDNRLMQHIHHCIPDNLPKSPNNHKVNHEGNVDQQAQEAIEDVWRAFSDSQ